MTPKLCITFGKVVIVSGHPSTILCSMYCTVKVVQYIRRKMYQRCVVPEAISHQRSQSMQHLAIQPVPSYVQLRIVTHRAKICQVLHAYCSDAATPVKKAKIAILWQNVYVSR